MLAYASEKGPPPFEGEPFFFQGECLLAEDFVVLFFRFVGYQFFAGPVGFRVPREGFAEFPVREDHDEFPEGALDPALGLVAAVQDFETFVVEFVM